MWLFDYFKKKRGERSMPLTEESKNNKFEQLDTNMKKSSCNCYNIEDIRTIPMGGGMRISPCNLGWLIENGDTDALILSLQANTTRIKKFLPGLDFSDKDKALNTLRAFCARVELDLGFAYVIRLGNGPMGMIFFE